MTNKDLSSQEQLFIDLLFDGATMRNPEEAKVLAGYPKEYPVLKLIRTVSEELTKKYDDFLVMVAPKGLKGMMDIIDDPNEPGSALKLKAVIELLDRSGVVKKEKTEAEKQSQSWIFYLPQKSAVDEQPTNN